MKRRTMLKRLGVAGSGLAAVTGSTNASPLDGELVRMDGDLFVVSAGVDPGSVSPDDCCHCDPDTGYNECYDCRCCQFCHAK